MVRWGRVVKLAILAGTGKERLVILSTLSLGIGYLKTLIYSVQCTCSNGKLRCTYSKQAPLVPSLARQSLPGITCTTRFERAFPEGPFQLGSKDASAAQQNEPAPDLPRQPLPVVMARFEQTLATSNEDFSALPDAAFAIGWPFLPLTTLGDFQTAHFQDLRDVSLAQKPDGSTDSGGWCGDLTTCLRPTSPPGWTSDGEKLAFADRHPPPSTSSDAASVCFGQGSPSSHALSENGRGLTFSERHFPPDWQDVDPRSSLPSLQPFLADQEVFGLDHPPPLFLTQTWTPTF